MTDRERALEQIVVLMQQHAISSAEVHAALPGERLGGGTTGSKLATLFGYLGAAFVVVGIATLIGVNWEKLSSLARVLVTLGTGAALLFYALWNQRSQRFPAITGALYALSYLLQPTGVMVALEEWGADGDVRIAVALTAAVMAMQAGLIHVRRGHPVLLGAIVVFAAIAFATFADLIGVRDDWIQLALGSGLTLCGLGLRGRHAWGVAAAAVLVGSSMTYIGAFELLESTAAEVLLPALSALGIYLSVVLANRLLLLTGVLSLLAYLAYFTAEYFAESVGWPVVLIILGLLFVAVGMLALRLNRRIAPRRR